MMRCEIQEHGGREILPWRFEMHLEDPERTQKECFAFNARLSVYLLLLRRNIRPITGLWVMAIMSRWALRQWKPELFYDQTNSSTSLSETDHWLLILQGQWFTGIQLSPDVRKKYLLIKWENYFGWMTSLITRTVFSSSILKCSLFEHSFEKCGCQNEFPNSIPFEGCVICVSPCVKFRSSRN